VSPPTIVLLHGQPDTSASFWALRRELRRRLGAAVRILAPDRPGYGANLRPVTDYAGNVDWLRGWLGRVDAGPALLVGHSWAGGVAALAAAAEPRAVAGLVLLSSVGPSCLLSIDPVLAAPVIGDAIAYSALALGRPFIRRRARSIIIEHTPASDTPFALASGLAMRHRPVWRSFVAEQRALIRELPDITDSLPTIAVPTRVITGTRDTVIPDLTPAALVRAIPGARRVDVDGPHDLQLRRPVPVAAEVAAMAEELAYRADGALGVR